MPLSYLALGDSYTIGEQVMLQESFPYQTVQILRQEYEISAPEIIAKTGWTTAELQAAISNYTFSENYDLVSLLIGVNNQYRGQNIDLYQLEFAELLAFAIKKAGGKTSNVFVLSIPDWGISPFGHDRDRAAISAEIDSYNLIAKKICEEQKIVFIDITTEQRADNDNPGFIAPDGLHPSGKEYAKWAIKLAAAIRASIHSSQPGTVGQ